MKVAVRRGMRDNGCPSECLDTAYKVASEKEGEEKDSGKGL